MAFAVASKRAPFLAGLLKNLLLAAPSSSFVLRTASFVATHRLFSSGGAPFGSNDTIGDEELIVFYERLQRTHPMFSVTERPATTHTPWRWWVSKKDENAVQVKMEMPGLAAENVKVQADPKAGLWVTGKGVKDPDDARYPSWYSGLIGLSPEAFELNQAQAEMKDGMFTVTVPRVKVDLGEKSTEIKVRKAE